MFNLDFNHSTKTQVGQDIFSLLTINTQKERNTDLKKKLLW